MRVCAFRARRITAIPPRGEIADVASPSSFTGIPRQARLARDTPINGIQAQRRAGPQPPFAGSLSLSGAIQVENAEPIDRTRLATRFRLASLKAPPSHRSHIDLPQNDQVRTIAPQFERQTTVHDVAVRKAHSRVIIDIVQAHKAAWD